MNGLVLLAPINSSVLWLKITLKCLHYHCGILSNNLGIISNCGVGDAANSSDCCAHMIRKRWERFHYYIWLQGTGGGTRQPERYGQA